MLQLDGTAQLAYYEGEDKARSGRSAKGVLLLEHIWGSFFEAASGGINSSNSSSGGGSSSGSEWKTFYVKTGERTFCMRTKDELELRVWTAVVNHAVGNRLRALPVA